MRKSHSLQNGLSGWIISALFVEPSLRKAPLPFQKEKKAPNNFDKALCRPRRFERECSRPFFRWLRPFLENPFPLCLFLPLFYHEKGKKKRVFLFLKNKIVWQKQRKSDVECVLSGTFPTVVCKKCANVPFLFDLRLKPTRSASPASTNFADRLE